MIAPAYMNLARLAELIKSQATELLDEHPGFWKFEYSEQLVFVLTDDEHNRMRIMSPIKEVEDVEDDIWLVLLQANFDRALDARYCVNDGTVWAAFIHPLEELSSRQFLDGLDQVVSLVLNFGESYASSNLVFGDE